MTACIQHQIAVFIYQLTSFIASIGAAQLICLVSYMSENIDVKIYHDLALVDKVKRLSSYKLTKIFTSTAILANIFLLINMFLPTLLDRANGVQTQIVYEKPTTLKLTVNTAYLPPASGHTTLLGRERNNINASFAANFLCEGIKTCGLGASNKTLSLVASSDWQTVTIAGPDDSMQVTDNFTFNPTYVMAYPNDVMEITPQDCPELIYTPISGVNGETATGVIPNANYSCVLPSIQGYIPTITFSGDIGTDYPLLSVKTFYLESARGITDFPLLRYRSGIDIMSNKNQQKLVININEVYIRALQYTSNYTDKDFLLMVGEAGTLVNQSASSLLKATAANRTAGSVYVVSNVEYKDEFIIYTLLIDSQRTVNRDTMIYQRVINMKMWQPEEHHEEPQNFVYDVSQDAFYSEITPNIYWDGTWNYSGATIVPIDGVIEEKLIMGPGLFESLTMQGPNIANNIVPTNFSDDSTNAIADQYTYENCVVAGIIFWIPITIIIILSILCVSTRLIIKLPHYKTDLRTLLVSTASRSWGLEPKAIELSIMSYKGSSHKLLALNDKPITTEDSEVTALTTEDTPPIRVAPL